MNMVYSRSSSLRQDGLMIPYNHTESIRCGYP